MGRQRGREEGRGDMKGPERHVRGCPRIRRDRIKIHCIKKLKFGNGKKRHRKFHSYSILNFLIYMTSFLVNETFYPVFQKFLCF